jgi:glucose-6-phosphate isomerase
MARRQTWFEKEDESAGRAAAKERGQKMFQIKKQVPPRTGKMTIVGFYVGDDLPAHILKGKVEAVQKYPKV